MIKTPAEGVIGRIKDTFSFTLKNLRGIMLPLIAINLIITIASFYLLDFLISLGTVGIIILAIFFIAYIVLLSGVNIGVIKYISDRMKNDISGGHCKDAISYGFFHVLNGLKVGIWYSTVYLIRPVLLLIVGYILVTIGSSSLLTETTTPATTTYIITLIGGFAVLVAYVWLIIKSFRIVFVIYHAVDTDNYSKEYFNDAIAYTHNNWWRILGNIIFASVVFGLVYFASVIATTFYTTLNPDTFSTVSTLIINLINGLLAAIFGGFITVFSYLLAKRLEFEHDERLELMLELSLERRKKERLKNAEL